MCFILSLMSVITRPEEVGRGAAACQHIQLIRMCFKCFSTRPFEPRCLHPVPNSRCLTGPCSAETTEPEAVCCIIGNVMTYISLKLILFSMIFFKKAFISWLELDGWGACKGMRQPSLKGTRPRQYFRWRETITQDGPICCKHVVWNVMISGQPHHFWGKKE